MSPRRERGSLVRMTHGTRETAYELRVRFTSAGDPPVGSVLGPHGTDQPFSGWLGLVRVLEDHCPPPMPPRGDHEEPR